MCRRSPIRYPSGLLTAPWSQGSGAGRRVVSSTNCIFRIQNMIRCRYRLSIAAGNQGLTLYRGAIQMGGVYPPIQLYRIALFPIGDTAIHPPLTRGGG